MGKRGGITLNKMPNSEKGYVIGYQKTIGPELEIRCPNCKTLCLVLRLTKSVLNFDVTCHHCGNVGGGKDLFLEEILPKPGKIA
jgi:hypothetical protein